MFLDTRILNINGGREDQISGFFKKNQNLLTRLKKISSILNHPHPRIAFLGYTDLMLNEREWAELGVDQRKLTNRENAEKLKRIHSRPDVQVVPTLSSALTELFGDIFELSVFDFTQYEGSEIEWDFNFPIDKRFENAFDIIIDNGTCEHIFNIGQAFINVHTMLNVGGIVLHTGPLCYPNHGFYGYNPTLFADFYEDNGCEVLDFCLESLVNSGGVSKNLVVYGIPKYERFKLTQVASENIDVLKLEYLVSALIRKNSQVEKITYPIQNKYRNKEKWV